MCYICNTKRNNNMDNDIKTLLDEFKTNFPNLDFSSIPEDWGGYNKLEDVLAPHVLEFSRNQWDAILNHKYDNLFQNGMPHVSWNTDREYLYCALYKAMKEPRPVKTWTETWDKCAKYSVTTPTGTVIEMRESHPLVRGFDSYRRDRYYLLVKDGPAEPVPTHCAVTIYYDKQDGAYLGKQFAGTFDQCVDWVAQSGCPNCKIFELK